MEAVGFAYPSCENGRYPDPQRVQELLDAGAQPDFIMPWWSANKQQG